MTELKPCPFCGESGENIKMVVITSNIGRVICKSCGCAGPMITNPDIYLGEAITAWNTRKGEKQ